ncbi:hypothetical protein [Larkinella terrae]|uniref:Uncharacterized protein n=1 Tax=Larkinella terrae TaxID=2025311 RepID=A0A7K0ENQ9_9BACT|nr:hypothetical protein [Larkinella terrae]MRS63362.1 hypothetical protein [Larkinella terrae]
MSIIYNNKGKQLAPCIISKAMYALKLKVKKPNNKKKCSNEYWITTVETVGKANNNTRAEIEEAIKEYDSLIK